MGLKYIDWTDVDEKTPESALIYMKVFVPGKDEAEQSAGRELSYEEYEEFIHYFVKGLESQYDSDMAKTCALQTMGVI